ncbi:hypothetical protein JOC48_001889 [Aquibacillus albus]|uniref:Uncharacterized protein n=1 Tax=Aquibacillus albus TaxID=1168171 RepID=A0ABS2MZQ9_9BACI|nr:hypothetical protein [Aquibacillus albus]
MNYIKEINAYYNQIETNPLSPSAGIFVVRLDPY